LGFSIIGVDLIFEVLFDAATVDVDIDKVDVAISVGVDSVFVF
jgi:hypothetical protein